MDRHDWCDCRACHMTGTNPYRSTCRNCRQKCCNPLVDSPWLQPECRSIRHLRYFADRLGCCDFHACGSGTSPSRKLASCRATNSVARSNAESPRDSIIRQVDRSSRHAGAFWRFSRSISRLTYQAAFSRSTSAASDFRPDRQMYLTAFPRLKFICSVTVMHSTPDGCDV